MHFLHLYKLINVYVGTCHYKCFENKYMPYIVICIHQFGIQHSMVIGRFETLLHQYNYNLFIFIYNTNKGRKLAHVIVVCFENEHMLSSYAFTNFKIQHNIVIGRF